MGARVRAAGDISSDNTDGHTDFSLKINSPQTLKLSVDALWLLRTSNHNTGQIEPELPVHMSPLKLNTLVVFRTQRHVAHRMSPETPPGRGCRYKRRDSPLPDHPDPGRSDALHGCFIGWASAAQRASAELKDGDTRRVWPASPLLVSTHALYSRTAVSVVCMVFCCFVQLLRRRARSFRKAAECGPAWRHCRGCISVKLRGKNGMCICKTQRTKLTDGIAKRTRRDVA